jgi:hypothetical protein
MTNANETSPAHTKGPWILGEFNEDDWTTELRGDHDSRHIAFISMMSEADPDNFD